MIILKGIFIFLIIFSFQNEVQPEPQKDLFDVTDIKSLKNFIRDSYNISKTDFKSFDKLTWDERNATVKEIAHKIYLLIENISAMRSRDERAEDILWSQYVLAKLKPARSKNFVELIELNYQIKTASKYVQLQNQKIIYSDSIHKHANYCSHVSGLYNYSVSDRFLHGIDYGWSSIMDVNNVLQLFLDLVDILSYGENMDNNQYDFCARVTPFHQELFNVYTKVIITTFEEFSVQYLALMGKSICQTSTNYYNNELRRMEENLVKSLKMIIDKTITALDVAKYHLYNCHVERQYKSYVASAYHIEERDLDLELERTMQKIIIAEPDLTTTQSCSHNCDLDSIKNTLNYAECDEFLDCQYLSSSYEVNYLTNNSRRYSHFIGDDRTEYGDKFRYSSENLRKSQVSRTYNAGGFNWCDYCICTCLIRYPRRSPHTVTVLSFRDQLSDIENNKAVTGLRFVKKDHMIHIQIMEGRILRHGHIASESWKPLEKFEYNESTKKFYVINNKDSKEQLEEGFDYGFPRIMNLDDVIAPKRHIVTGVRFRFAGDSLDTPKLKNGPIELQIRVTPYDFLTGKLININQSEWISLKDKSFNYRHEVVLKTPGNPLYPQEEYTPIISSNKFVVFQESDLKKDAGQSTVPFFEGREVSFYKSSPLSGVGLIHRGHPGSGGHIALKIYDFDMSPYFNAID